MVMNRKVTGTASTIPGGLAIAGGISMGITLILAIAAAKLVDSQTIAESSIGYLSLSILMIASFCGSLAAWKRIKRKRLAVCLGAGAVYYGLLLLLTAVFFGGQYQGMGVTALVVAAGCGCVILTGAGQGSGRKKRRANRYPR